MRAMSIAAIVNALIAIAPISAAADQTITESFNLTIPNSTVPLRQNPIIVRGFFPLFDPGLGKLDSVNVTVTGSVSVASLDENPNVLIQLFGFTSSILDLDVFQSGTTDLKLSGPDVVAFYLGPRGSGQVSLFVSYFATPANAFIKSDGPLSGVVAYGYTPATLAIPETPTWAMMLLGFAGLGLAGYRASRKSVAFAA
jgi:hypothetical protein